MQIKSDDLVIGRYSVLPFYKELEDDIKSVNAKLINTYKQHKYVADCKNWAVDLDGLTPKTWTRLEDLPEDGPFVLKGETNSKKFLWKSHMFAEDKKRAIEIHSLLCADSLIGEQDIIIRQYIPLHTYMIGLQDLPITKEFRFFILNGRVISSGYYWSSHVEEIKEKLGKIPSSQEVPIEFMAKAINSIKSNINFFTIDVAQTESGEWIVIELNDGQMSGLSENNPEVLYANLYNNLRESI